MLAVVIFLSEGTVAAFDPYSTDPLSPGRNNGSALKPDEITLPALSLTLLEGPVSSGTQAPEASKGPAPQPESSPKPSPAPSVEKRHMAPEITRGATGDMNISVTFDGGGYESGEEAEAILSTLRERSIKATIFLTGLFIRKYPGIVREMVRDGHEIGNHTLDHHHLTDFSLTLRQTTSPGIDKTFVEKELRGAAELFRAATGAEMAPLWRAPYGDINGAIRDWAFESGYVHVGWTYDAKKKESLDTLDWVYDRKSRLYRTSSKIKQRILNFGKGSAGLNGGIILMHLGTLRKDDRASNILGEMLDALAEKGYRFVKVSEQLKGTGLLQAAVRNKRHSAAGLVRFDGWAGRKPTGVRQ